MKKLPHWRMGLTACALAVCAWPALALEGRVVANGLSDPLYVTAPKGDARLFVVEKGGVIRVIKNGKITKFLDISSRVGTAGERGLLGLAFDPDYATNGRFYVDYTDVTSGATKIARFTVSPPTANKADASTRQEIISINQPGFDNHKGGWIGFRPGDKKNLYISMGDGGSGYDPDNNAQNGQVLLGKMLRIDVSGTGAGYKIPADNPFVNSSSVKPEVWALGLRNTFRASFDRKTGAFWMGDVGQDSREEIDFEAAGDPGGRNYGWRLREGMIKTPGGVGGDKPGLTNPVFDYPHLGSQGSLGNCVTGGYVYRGPTVNDANGRYFFGDCVSDRAFSMTFNADGTPKERREETASLLSGNGLTTLASFGEDGKGRLYVVGLSGVVIVMCPSAAGQTRSTVPPSVAGEPRVWADVASPCTAR
ncbi:PQQ-dependent sugar dehydrogenase [Ideonella sp. DXS29W]|uniref:PQQ-dependent sugar dehydrogenase n=1 Tax=Ideonella lacteola TaxID=2984193 RepID=A0ABU9BTH9_9BURK